MAKLSELIATYTDTLTNILVAKLQGMKIEVTNAIAAGIREDAERHASALSLVLEGLEIKVPVTVPAQDAAASVTVPAQDAAATVTVPGESAAASVTVQAQTAAVTGKDGQGRDLQEASAAVVEATASGTATVTQKSASGTAKVAQATATGTAKVVEQTIEAKGSVI